jgi:molybdopterin biosynthesis enzyme
MVEETAAADETLVEILAEVSPGQNVGRRGADITAGDLVVRRQLGDQRQGAAAVAGRRWQHRH